MSLFMLQVIKYTTHIEACLVKRGGSGDGLRDKAESAKPPLDQNLLKRIREIGAVRNEYSHEHGYEYPGDKGEFLALCESVIRDLGAVPEKYQINPNTSQVENQVGMNGSKGGEMSNVGVDAWVVTLEDGIYGATIDSTPSLRSVLYYRGGVVEVIPLGKSCLTGIKLFSSLQTVKQVKMDSRLVPVSFPKVETKDKADVSVQLSVYFNVMDDERAIRRVADDAAGQQAQSANSLLPVLQNVIGQYAYLNLPSHADVAEQLIRKVRDTHKPDPYHDSFEVRKVIVESIEVNDSDVRTYVKDAIKVEFEKHLYNKELERRIREAESAQNQFNTNLENQKAVDNAQLEILKKKGEIASTFGGMFAINPEAAMNLEAVKIKSEAEIEKARTIRTIKDIKNEAEIAVFRSLHFNTVRHNITDQSDDELDSDEDISIKPKSPPSSGTTES